jgi:hypothetical protein
MRGAVGYGSQAVPAVQWSEKPVSRSGDIDHTMDGRLKTWSIGSSITFPLWVLGGSVPRPV